ncbi:MAG: transglycosylase family protein [Candidatus Levybacteria bacterium]|nr:transglycosylase family protein [Candidatus Levybacteria bacterium]
MERAKQYFEPLFFNLALRVGFVIAIMIGMIVFVTQTSVKAHSESDVKYKQESIFAGAGLSARAQNELPETNPSPAGLDEDVMQPVSMSFDIDKVTPTPTPVIAPESDDIWIRLAQCESKQNWSIDTGNGYYGGLQFSLGAWASVGGLGKPSDASKDEQIAKGKLLQQRRGWGAWGGCAKKLGLN